MASARQPNLGGASFTPLRRIETSGGEVLRALRSDEAGFRPVEEAYFSWVNPEAVRGWKCHREMTVNVVVPVGHVMFVVVDDEPAVPAFTPFDLGPAHAYGRLTIAPGRWFGFKGGVEGGLVLNLADVLHDPDEVTSADLDHFDYNWNL